MTSEQITILIVGLFSIVGLWIITRPGAAIATMGDEEQTSLSATENDQ